MNIKDNSDLLSTALNNVRNGKFGLELEYNNARYPDIAGRSPNWLLAHGWENSIIRELGTSAAGIIQHIRRMAVLGTVLEDEHCEGHDDPRAGSVHMHYSLPDNESHRGWQHIDALPLLCFATHMRRDPDDDYFRDAVGYRCRLNVEYRKLPCDTKRYWVCNNTGPGSAGTLENRLNETTKSYVPLLFMPLLSVFKRIVEESATNQTLVVDGFTDHVGHHDESVSSFSVEAAARKAIGRLGDKLGGYEGMLDIAIDVYAEARGSLYGHNGPKSQAIQDLPVAILEAARDGADQFDIHDAIVVPAFAQSALFGGMVERLGGEV